MCECCSRKENRAVIIIFRCRLRGFLLSCCFPGNERRFRITDFDRSIIIIRFDRDDFSPFNDPNEFLLFETHFVRFKEREREETVLRTSYVIDVSVLFNWISHSALNVYGDLICGRCDVKVQRIRYFVCLYVRFPAIQISTACKSAVIRYLLALAIRFRRLPCLR